MNQKLEEKDSPALKSRLQALGFEQVEFEPKVCNRFIVQIENFPSHVIKGVRFPCQLANGGWTNGIELKCYNPLNAKLEESAIALVRQETVDITIKILTPTAHVDTVWHIIGRQGRVSFGDLDWSDEGEASQIFLYFDVDSATISYPTE
jgi:hypothetical protein